MISTQISMYNLNISHGEFKTNIVVLRNELNIFIFNDLMIYKVSLVEPYEIQRIWK